MAKFTLEVFTPQGKILSNEVDSVIAPGVVGELEVLAEHLPALVQLGGGSLRYKGESSGELFVRGGVLEVTRTGIIVLTEESQTPDALNADKAKTILEQATQSLEKADYAFDSLFETVRQDSAYAQAILNSQKK
jgi:F-type H+-transporting ATPase subunit epsilon